MLNAWSFGSGSCRTRRIVEQIYALSWRSLHRLLLRGFEPLHRLIRILGEFLLGDLESARQKRLGLLAAFFNQTAVVGLDPRQVIGARSTALVLLAG